MRRINVPSLFIANLVGLALAFSASTANAGKPTPPPPPPLPAMRYQIQFFDTPGVDATIYDLNNLGQCVGIYTDTLGWKRGFFYDPAIDSANAIDLNALATPPAGWVIAAGVSINDYGVVVGYLEPAGSPWDPNFRMGFALDTSASVPVFSLLPEAVGTYASAFEINENGDVLGGYRNSDNTTWSLYLFNPSENSVPVTLGINILSPWYVSLNNPTESHDIQVGGVLTDGAAFRWTRGSGVETLIVDGPGAGPVINDINDVGTVCGYTSVKLSKNSYQQRAMRISTTIELLPTGYFSAGAINMSGDVTLGSAIYQDSWGAINMDKLIDGSDPDSVAWFSNSRSSFALLDMNDRIAGPNFGQVAASVAYSNGTNRLCLLTPVSINP